MTDALVDLQDHLTGHQQQVAGPRRTLGGGKQGEGLLGDPLGIRAEADLGQPLQPTLTAPVRPPTGAGLGLAAGIGHGHQPGGDLIAQVANLATVAGDQQLPHQPPAQPGGAVDDAWVDLQGRAGVMQQVELVHQAQGLPGLHHRAGIVRPQAGTGIAIRAEEPESGMPLRPARRPRPSGRQTGGAEVRGGAIADATPLDQGQHGAQAGPEGAGFRHPLADRQMLRLLADQAQGPVIRDRGGGAKAVGDGVQIFHGR